MSTQGSSVWTELRSPMGAPAAVSNLPRPFLEWRDQWTLEVGFMDEDHRALAERLNRLARDWGLPGGAEVSAERGGETPAALIAVLEELATHTRAHFEREEGVMRIVDYPELAAHKGEHDLLLAEFRIRIREIRQARLAGLDRETLDSIKDWLMGHVLEVDRRLADFLKNGPTTSAVLPPVD